MATTYSANARLQKPGAADRLWEVPINANTDALDAMTAVGSLVVTTTETPSATLRVRVAAGTFVRADGTVGAFNGVPAFAVPANATVVLWLDGSGMLNSGPAFPTSAHLRLAQVVVGASAVTQVIDARVNCMVAGSGLGFVLKAGDTISGPLTIAAATTGSATPALVVADPVKQLLGFFGATPAGPAPALTPLVGVAGATVADTLADVGASFAQQTLNNNFASLAAKVDSLITALKRHGLMASQ